MSFQASIAKNRSKYCSAPGCSSHRHNASSCCARHYLAQRVHGHPLGKHLPAKLWAGELAEVSELLDRNADQPAVIAALLLLKQWTERALSRDSQQPAARAFQRFHDYGVEPLMLIKVASAVWLYSYRHAYALPNDVRLDRAVALACIKLVPRDKGQTLRGIKSYRPHDAASRRELGPLMREYLAPLFVNIKTAVDQQWHAKNQALSGLRIPLTTP